VGTVTSLAHWRERKLAALSAAHPGWQVSANWAEGIFTAARPRYLTIIRSSLTGLAADLDEFDPGLAGQP
jgi:hypothetical protein